MQKFGWILFVCQMQKVIKQGELKGFELMGVMLNQNLFDVELLLVVLMNWQK